MPRFLALMSMAILLTPFSLERTDSQDPTKVDPAHFKILFENGDVRVLEVTVQPGERVPKHSHPAGFAYALSDFKAKTTLLDGSTVEGEYKTGQYVETKPVTHIEENTGTTEAHLLLIEFKTKAAEHVVRS
jgi:hypothetical protein